MFAVYFYFFGEDSKDGRVIFLFSYCKSMI